MRWNSWVSIAVVLFSVSAARAAITTSGNLAGGGTPYNGTDNPWTTTGLIVGDTAPGSMSITGGSIVTGINSLIANQSTASLSVVTVDGPGSHWTSTNPLFIGYSGTGALNITAGGSVSSGASYLNYLGANNSTATVGGGVGSSTWAINGSLYVPFRHNGALTISGGGNVSSGVSLIGHLSSSNGTVTVGGGTGSATWTVVSQLVVGDLGAGNLDIVTGGSVSDQGSYTQGSTGKLEFELGPAAEAAGWMPLVINGTAALAGTLQIDPAAGFVPMVGEMFDVLTSVGGVSGTFGSVNPYWIGNGRLVYFTTIYGANKVTIDVTSVVSVVPGDYNGNGVVDAADYTVWRDHVGQNYALLNRDSGASGPIGATDYNFWVTHFGSTGTGVGAAAPVPEPGTILLLLMAVMGCVVRMARQYRRAN